jgi:hypothetical protein
MRRSAQEEVINSGSSVQNTADDLQKRLLAGAARRMAVSDAACTSVALPHSMVSNRLG